MGFSHMKGLKIIVIFLKIVQYQPWIDDEKIDELQAITSFYKYA